MGSMESPKNFQSEALVVMSPGAPFTMKPIILDEVRDDELLIEMKYSGICHTVGSNEVLQINVRSM